MIAETGFVYVDYEPHGGAQELFYASDREVLFEGPAGTGKTRAVCEYIRFLCETVQGLRVLFLRDTKVNLAETVLDIWENEVLGKDHPAIHGTAGRANRRTYEFPDTEALVVLGGMSNPRNFMSGQFDVIVLFEATDIRDERKYQKLTTRLRNFKLWYQQLISDCNPADEFHFLNLRAQRKLSSGRPVMRRILSRHKDNARYWDHARDKPTREGRDYFAGLDALTGPDRDRYLEGKWVAAEGRALDNWHPARHCVRGSLEYQFDDDDNYTLPLWGQDGCVQLTLDEGFRGPQGQTKIALRWFSGSIDWGYREPGVFQVWGHDADRNAFRIAEVYFVQRTIDWWADRILEFVKAFRIRAVWADPSRPDNIVSCNKRLGRLGGRDGRPVVVAANNAREAGFDQVKWALGSSEEDQRAWWVDTWTDQPHVGVWGPDSELEARGVWSSEMEFPGLTWAEKKEGHQGKEEFHPECPDHGYDATRYDFMGVWGRDQFKPPPPPEYQLNSAYYTMGHAEEEKKARDRTVADERLERRRQRIRRRHRRKDR